MMIMIFLIIMFISGYLHRHFYAIWKSFLKQNACYRMGVKRDWEIVDIRNNQIAAVKYCLRLQITRLTNDYLSERLE